VTSELIVEWRALTVTLLDRLRDPVGRGSAPHRSPRLSLRSAGLHAAMRPGHETLVAI